MAFGFGENKQTTYVPEKFIPVSTGDLGHPYHVIDSIFAICSSTEGIFSGVDLNGAFNGVKERLRQNCAAVGGDAVIYAQFEYRVAVNSGFGGSKQVIEFFAYGTAVKFLTQ